MTERDVDKESDDGIVAEDITQLVEHIELTGEHRLSSGPEWELATPAEDLDDAPILVDDAHQRIPDLEHMEVAEDIELFTDTEIDLNRRLLQVEDEQLELAAALAVERAHWQKRIESLQMDLAERNQLLAEHEAEIENLSARLASLTLERDGYVAQLRESRRSAEQVEATAVQQLPSPAEGVIDNLRERLQERGRTLLAARDEIDRLRADRERLVAGLAERGDFIQRLHERLRALEGGYKGGGELRNLLGRFFGGKPRSEALPAASAVPTPVTESPEDPLPRHVAIEEPQREPSQEEAEVEPAGEPRLRRYLIGLDLVGRVHEIAQPRISVGRTQDNDLRIVDSTVSRLHAVLKLGGRDVTVIDANSTNGVYVNGIQVRHAKLADGDLVTFGTVRFRYRVGSGAAGDGYGPA